MAAEMNRNELLSTAPGFCYEDLSPERKLEGLAGQI